MKKTLSLLLFALLCSVGITRATNTDLISGVTLPDMPEGTLDCATQTLVMPDANDYLVFKALSVRGHQTWFLENSGGSGKGSWNANDPFPAETAGDSNNFLKVRQTSRTYAFRFTSATEALIYGKSNSSGRTLNLAVYEVVAGVPTTLIDNIKTINTTGILSVVDLDATKEYVAYTYASTDNDAQLYMIALKRETVACTAPANELSLSLSKTENIVTGDIITLTANGGNGAAVKFYDGNEEITSPWTATVGAHSLSAKQDTITVGGVLYCKGISDPIAITVAAQTFAVTYKANGGVGDDIADPAASVVAANTFTREGHRFIGWNTAADGTGTPYAVGADVTSALTLFAQWEAFFTVTYMDGTTVLGSEDVVAGNHPNAAGINAMKPLASFDGWFLNSDLSGNAVDLNTISSTTTLYGKWTIAYAADAEYVFENNDTVGGMIVSSTGTNYEAFQIDNLFFSAMKIEYEAGIYSGDGNDFKGWKIKTASATIRFNLQNDRRVSVTVGNLSSGLNITYSPVGAESDTTVALVAKMKNHYDVKGGTLVTLTTAGSNTVTLKGIAIGAIPAISDDATLSDLKVGGETVKGFSSNNNKYYVELPYGTAHADFPVVTVTTNDEHAVAIVNDAKDRQDSTTVVKVTAEDGTEKYYNVYFTVAPKDGICLVKVNLEAGSSKSAIASTEGALAGTCAINTAKDLKLGNTDHYVKVALSEGNYFQAGDVVAIHFVEGKSCALLQLFSDAGTTLIAEKSEGIVSGGINRLVLPDTLPANVSEIYLYRTSTGGSSMNPYVQAMEVSRVANPFIVSFMLDSIEATIDNDAHTIALVYPLTKAPTANAEPVMTVASNTADSLLVKAVTTNEGNWVVGNNTYRITDKYGDYTEYTVTISQAESTDIRATKTDNEAVKFIENGQLYIRRDGNIYDTTGRQVR